MIAVFLLLLCILRCKISHYMYIVLTTMSRDDAYTRITLTVSVDLFHFIQSLMKLLTID